LTTANPQGKCGQTGRENRNKREICARSGEEGLNHTIKGIKKYIGR